MQEVLEALRFARSIFDSNKLDESYRYAERGDWKNCGISLRQFFEDRKGDGQDEFD